MGEQGKKQSTTGAFVGFAVSAAVLYFVLRGLDWQLLAKELGAVQWVYLPLLVLLFLLSFTIRAFRWRYLLPNGEALSLRALFDAALVGFFATCVLPLRAGEFVRPLVLSRWQPVTFTLGFASIVIERVFDVIMLMVFLGLSFGELDNLSADTAEGEQLRWLIATGSQALTVVAVVILVVMIFAYFYSETMLSLVRKLATRLLARRKPELAEKLIAAAGNFLAGLKGISSFRQLAMVIVWTAALWLNFVAIYQIGVWSFGSFPSPMVGMTLTVLIALAVAAPSAPGFIGTFQLGCVAALHHIYSYSKEFAVAYSVLLHGYQVLLAVLFGLWILRSRGLGLSEMRRSSQEAQS